MYDRQHSISIDLDDAVISDDVFREFLNEFDFKDEMNLFDGPIGSLDYVESFPLHTSINDLDDKFVSCMNFVQCQ